MELDKLYQKLIANKLISIHKKDLIISYTGNVSKLNRDNIYSETVDFVSNLIDEFDEHIERNSIVENYNLSGLLMN